MDNSDISENLDFLIDRWCSRKELEPLRKVLNGKAGINGLTDGWAELLLELKSVRAQDKGNLQSEEYDMVVELIHTTEKILGR